MADGISSRRSIDSISDFSGAWSHSVHLEALKLFDLYQKSFRWTASEIDSMEGPDEIRDQEGWHLHLGKKRATR
jgi:hypothetical protein